MDDRIWCPNCHKWRFVEVLKSTRLEDEGIVLVFKRECECTACKHTWVDVERVCLLIFKGGAV